MRGCIFCQTFALAHVSAQGSDLGFGAEATTQQAIGMQLTQPSGIADIGFAIWHILGIAGVDEDDFEPVCFQDLEGRYPVIASRFHRHAGNVA